MSALAVAFGTFGSLSALNDCDKPELMRWCASRKILIFMRFPKMRILLAFAVATAFSATAASARSPECQILREIHLDYLKLAATTSTNMALALVSLVVAQLEGKMSETTTAELSEKIADPMNATTEDAIRKHTEFKDRIDAVCL